MIEAKWLNIRSYHLVSRQAKFCLGLVDYRAYKMQFLKNLGT